MNTSFTTFYTTDKNVSASKYKISSNVKRIEPPLTYRRIFINGKHSRISVSKNGIFFISWSPFAKSFNITNVNTGDSINHRIPFFVDNTICSKTTSDKVLFYDSTGVNKSIYVANVKNPSYNCRIRFSTKLITDYFDAFINSSTSSPLSDSISI